MTFNKIEHSPNKVYLAFLDILGFSNFIKENTHQDAVNIYNNLFRVGIQLASAKVAQTIRGKSFFQNVDGKEGMVKPILENVRIRSIVISDTVIFWTESDSLIDFSELTVTVWQAMNFLFSAGLPLRGAITHGELTFAGGQLPDNPLMLQYQLIGKPLVEAAELEKKQTWAGCVIHPNVISNGPHLLKNLSFFEENGHIIKYNVPMKNNSHEEMYAINWVLGIKTKPNPEMIRDIFSSHKKTIKDIDTLILNTEKFFEDMSELSKKIIVMQPEVQ
jgi:hypothetical protein